MTSEKFIKALKIFNYRCLQQCGYFILSIVMLFMTIDTTAQHQKTKEQQKLSSLLFHKQLLSKKGNGTFTLVATNMSKAKLFLKEIDAKILYEYTPSNIIVAEFAWQHLPKLIEQKEILFIDEKQAAKEELIFGFIDFGTNKVTTLHNLFPNLTGKNTTVCVKENKPDTTDIDFRGRFISTPFSSATVSGHASIMTTMIAGGGNTWNNTKGVAWQSNISSASFQNLLPEPNSFYTQNNISVQNHSYGTVNENFYGAEASAYDASVTANQTLVHIFSAGNSGTATPSTGIYATIPGFSNMTGNFKQSKNIITVGHIDSFYNVLAPSSKGPAFDGRIKPELVAFGEDGSSGAAAIVSGIALTLQQAYKEKNSNTLPPAALIKAVLLNSADDVGNPGIDFSSGFGSANAFKAMQTIQNNQYTNGTVSNGGTQNFTITVPNNIKQLKITICWTDVQAPPNSTKALINDLDLELFHAAGNTTWLPWVLSSFANKDSLQKLPVRKKDNVNNTEQITVENPVGGTYQIIVKGFAVPAGTQNFSIAWQMDTLNTFRWYHPGKDDHFINGQSNVIRWQSNYSAATGVLEYSVTNGINWQLISNTVNLQKGVFQFNPPDVYSKALLRMTIGANQFITDTFTISKRINTSVAFNCEDSFSIVWPRVSGINNYQVYKLGNQYLEPLFVTTDTALVLSKNSNQSLYYAVAPLLANKPAVRSYTINYNSQGVGCYISNLLADLNINNEAELQLSMGTILSVKSIRFEKQTASGFSLLEKKTTITDLQILSLDKNVRPGSNNYRVVVELQNGELIFSSIVTLYYIGTKPAVVYPNPVLLNGSLTILSKQEDQLMLQLMSADGRVVLQQKLVDFPQQVPLTGLAKGFYFYRLLKDGKKVQSGSFIIQ
jgi:hypothetical protein